jgi:hypothetical protein
VHIPVILTENYRNINGCKTFAASIAQTLVDKQVKFNNFILQIGTWQITESIHNLKMVSSFDNTIGSIKQTFKTFSLTFI